MMDSTRTQSAYRPLPRLETDRPRAVFAAALETLLVPCLCLLFAGSAFLGTYCWMLLR